MLSSALMRFSNRGGFSRNLALALASSQVAFSTCVPTHNLMATSFSLNAQHTATDRFRGTSKAAMSTTTNKSFNTWTFDEPCKTMEWSELSGATLATASKTSDWDADADLVVVGVYAPKSDSEADGDNVEVDPSFTSASAKELDDKLGGALSMTMRENAKAFKNGANMGSLTPTLRVLQDGKSQRFAVIGLGTIPDEDSKDTMDGVGTAIGKALATLCDSEKKVKKTKVLLPEAITSDEAALTRLSTAFYTALYSDNRYRTGKNVKNLAEDLETVTLVSEGSTAEGAASSLETGKMFASGVFMAKDIVNSPHNVLNSISLADTAKRIAAESGGTMKCTILSKDECEERGMGAYLGVARAGETEPQFIHLTYSPPDGVVNKKIGLVGKGLLFDTGGYNIKTAMMELMKFDCGGAAAVLGAARAISAMKPPGVEAHFVVAACENMINEKGIVPSDILVASNGMTIEILNTDAEGRLTLADALVYCDKELGCESIVEVSTLTGACMVALGLGMSGYWTDDDALAAELADVAKVSEDKAWRMPLEKSYNKALESKIADIKNVADRYGGAIHAGLFLQHFVDKKKPFAHIDVAGPAWDNSIGATGYGAKLVTEWIRRQGQSG